MARFGKRVKMSGHVVGCGWDIFEASRLVLFGRVWALFSGVVAVSSGLVVGATEVIWSVEEVWSGF